MIFILIAILFNVNYVELKTQNEVAYRQLKWQDFKVKKTVDNTVSESVTSIGYDYDGYKTVSVFCNFNKDESYVTLKGRTTYILKHEQHHFDVTYAYSLKFINELRKQPALNKETIESIYEKILSEKDNLQSQYDNETNNSENKELQALWNIKIDKLLTNL